MAGPAPAAPRSLGRRAARPGLPSPIAAPFSRRRYAWPASTAAARGGLELRGRVGTVIGVDEWIDEESGAHLGWQAAVLWDGVLPRARVYHDVEDLARE